MITIDDISKIYVPLKCNNEYPCKHECTVYLSKGRKATLTDALDICSVINNIAKKKIRSNRKRDDVLQHFERYKYDLSYTIPDAQTVLEKRFNREMVKIEPKAEVKEEPVVAPESWGVSKCIIQ